MKRSTKVKLGVGGQAESDLRTLRPRRETDRTGRFHRGTHAPFAIRWFGMSALAGHLRHLVATAAASNDLDIRDWMQPDEPAILLDRVCEVLGASNSGNNLAERLGREVWIDFVADTGDDHDVSLEVGGMLFSEYSLSGDEARVLPRGDVLLFGGDTAYPAATANELQRRLLQPWNSLLRQKKGSQRPRVLLGIPGNHDWYSGLDGFGRLFRKSVFDGRVEPMQNQERDSSPIDSRPRRVEGFLERHLHLDELAESVNLAHEAIESLEAFVRGAQVKKFSHLILAGYRAAQEASYWALPLAPDLDLWGVDRQLRTADFRQRVFFANRRAGTRSGRILFVAPDPALAFGEPNDPGVKLLEACRLSLDSDKLFYLTGDAHHYERLTSKQSIHVIAGGGGAFLHGTRISRGSGTASPEFVYPDKKDSLRLALGMPPRLAAGTAGFLPHGLFALLAALTLILGRGPVSRALVVLTITVFVTVGLSFAVRTRIQRPAATWLVSTLFGVTLGLAPFSLRFILQHILPRLSGFWPVVLGQAFLGSFLLGMFLLVLEFTGIDHQHGFAVLGHPGFRHFVRLCVHPSGKVEGFVIGKDDPLGEGPPVLVDRFVW
jgi:hypothetical protein